MHKLGWWFVNYKGKEGWAPSSYLEPENGIGIITEEESDEVCIQTQEGERETEGERKRVHYCLPLQVLLQRALLKYSIQKGNIKQI